MKTIQVSNEVFIPDELLYQIAELVEPLVIEKISKQLDIWDKMIDLPPAPNKSQIKKTLGIGEDTLNFLIANGATPMIWGENTVRIERADIRKAFEKTKLTN